MLILSSLLYPVLFILVLMVLGIIIQAGGFWAEWLIRSRLAKHLPEALLRFIREGRPKGVWPPGDAFYRLYYRINCGLFTVYHLTDLFDANTEMTIMKQHQDGEMELITKEGEKIKAVKVSREKVQGQGQRLGIAYRLQDDTMVYVPEE